MATENDSTLSPVAANVHHLPTSRFPRVKQSRHRGRLPAGVASLQEARAAAQARGLAVATSLRTDLDEATRDLYTAADLALKMVFLTRDRLGLPRL